MEGGARYILVILTLHVAMFNQCFIHDPSGGECDPRTSVIGLACQKPSYAVCPGASGIISKTNCEIHLRSNNDNFSEPHGNKCYDFYVIDDERVDFVSAQKVCEENGGGHLVQIEDQKEADFISELLLTMDDSIGALWTGGILNTAAGKTFLAWHHTKTPITFSQFISPTAATDNTHYETLGIALVR
jgi:hypothetical protein